MSEEKIRVLIVDDSPFSRAVITNALMEGGCEVVGEAESLETLMAAYDVSQPDIVTMDIAMPGADGFECSKALHLHHPEAKIILVSSMKDAETEAEAKRIGVVGYVQKPVDGDVLVTVIKNIMSPDLLYQQLDSKVLETFKEALGQNVTRMIKLPVIFNDDMVYNTKYISQGITVVIGIIGRYSGSMILDVSPEVAEKMAEAVLKRPVKSKEEVLAMVAELANIVAGVACSMLNKSEKAFALRVSPPSLFHGTSAQVISPGLQIQGAFADVDFGRIMLGIGFKKGLVLWM